MWVASPNRITALLCVVSIGVAATPSITGLAPWSVEKNDWTPIATPPMSITLTFLFARNFWAQVVPSSSAEAMKQVTSWIGWPPTPPSSALAYLTAISAPAVASSPTAVEPPCWLT